MRWLNLFKANLNKEYIELKRYLPNTIAMLVTFYVIFLGMFFGIQLIGDPASQDANIQYTIVSYIFWFMGMMLTNSVGWQVTNEAMRGTLEQLSMSPMGIWKILTARLVATTVLYFVMIVFLLYLSMFTTGQWLNVDLVSILPILVLTLVSMFGVGFMIAGISIVWKQVDSFLQILQFIIAALTFVSVSTAPFMVLLPFVKGIDMVRDVMINETTLMQLGSTNFMILTANAVIYFALGLFIFLMCEKTAMRKGLLAHY